MISLTETREERHNEMRTQAKDPEGLGPPSSQIGSEEYPERPPCRTLRDETHTEKDPELLQGEPGWLRSTCII